MRWILKLACAIALIAKPLAAQALNVSVVPSLQLQVHVIRKTMRTHNATDFQVIATPTVTTNAVNGSSVIAFDAVATFQDGGMIYKYAIADGVGYYVIQDSDGKTAATCALPDSLPPIHDILFALNTAKAVSVVSTKMDCPRGNKLAAKLGSQTFIVCAAAHAGFHIYGSNFEVSAKFLSSRTEIHKPTILDADAQSCPTIANSAAVSSSTLALLTNAGDVYFNRFTDEATERAMVSLRDSSCSCKGQLRPCIFVHGMGHKADGGLVDSLSYFGDIAKHAPCCSSIKYTELNTVDNPWYSSTLQDRICDYTLSRSASSNTQTRVIADTIIVTHSMGGLMVAGALANGKCSIGSNVDWVSISAPMKGSMGADFLQDACTQGGSYWVNMIGKLAGVIGQCPASGAISSLMYQTGKYCSAYLSGQYSAAQQAFHQHVTAAMCSNSYEGLVSDDQAVLQLAGKTIPHKSPQNDGVVEFQSCRGDLPEGIFSDSYSNTNFYVTKLNHLDTAFRHGDGWFDDAKMPVQWFECLL